MKKRNKSILRHDEKELGKLRRNIDAIDFEIVRLLNRRALNALMTGMIKKKAGIGVYDASREDQVLARVQKLNKGPLSKPAVSLIYRSIISACRARQK